MAGMPGLQPCTTVQTAVYTSALTDCHKTSWNQKQNRHVRWGTKRSKGQKGWSRAKKKVRKKRCSLKATWLCTTIIESSWEQLWRGIAVLLMEWNRWTNISNGIIKEEKSDKVSFNFLFTETVKTIEVWQLGSLQTLPQQIQYSQICFQSCKANVWSCCD